MQASRAAVTEINVKKIWSVNFSLSSPFQSRTAKRGTGRFEWRVYQQNQACVAKHTMVLKKCRVQEVHHLRYIQLALANTCTSATLYRSHTLNLGRWHTRTAKCPNSSLSHPPLKCISRKGYCHTNLYPALDLSILLFLEMWWILRNCNLKIFQS